MTNGRQFKTSFLILLTDEVVWYIYIVGALMLEGISIEKIRANIVSVEDWFGARVRYLQLNQKTFDPGE